MKKIIYSLLFASVLSGCYEDKGNYEYTLDSMNEITSVSFYPSIKNNTIEVQQALDENDTYRRIDAKLSQTLSENLDKLQFNWFRTYKDADGKIVRDTIHSKGFLEFELPVGKAMEYDVFLQIYDETTTLSHYSKFKIATRPLFKNSLFVLHGEEGQRKLGNIEVIGNETKIRTDITTVTPEENDANWYDNAVGLAYTTYLGKSEDRKSEKVNNLIVFNKGTKTVSYNPFGMIRNTYKIFRPEILNETFVFKKMIMAGYGERTNNRRIALSENGEVCIANYTHALYKPGYQIELNGGNEKHQSDYNITAAAVGRYRFVFWDAKHNRFLYCYSREDNKDFPKEELFPENSYLTSSVEMRDAYIDFTTLTKVPSPEGMTAVLGYINYGEESFERGDNNIFFVFKDEENGKFYRYELTRIRVESDTKSQSISREVNKPAFSITGEELNGFMKECDLSTVTYNTQFATNYLFYSDGKNNIYRYSVVSGDNVLVYTAPDGYDITMMKFRTNDSSLYAGDLRRILSIALYNGTNGAVAEIMFNTAADVDQDFTPLFYDKGDDNSKWGKIKDLQFTDEHTYVNPYEENNENN